jgi:outer membrane protein assembly factor BamD
MRTILKSVIILSCVIAFLYVAGCSKSARPEMSYDPEKYLQRSDELVNKKEYAEARKVLLEVKNRDTQKKYGALAHLKIADSYAREKEPDLAVLEYRKFIDLYPTNQYASYAQYQIGMTYFSQIESAERGTGAARTALVEFNRLKTLYPRNPYRDVVELRIEKCRNILAEGDYVIAAFYYKKDSYAAAANRLEGLVSKYPDYKDIENAFLLLGKSYIELKQKDKARTALDKLIKKYPSSKAAKEAQKLRGKI